MPTSPFHAQADLGQMHRAHNWEYASAAARLAAGGFASSDVNKIALQLDDKTLWILTDHTIGSWRKLASPLFNNRGNYDATPNTFPATGGSGAGGDIIADDIWYISGDGTLGGTPVVVGEAIRALEDAPAQDANKWQIYDKSTDIIGEENIMPKDRISIWNLARTFKSLITSTILANRTYTLPNMDGEVSVLGIAATVAAVTSTPLGASDSPHTNITGSDTITSFDTVAAGIYRHGIFTGVCTLVHDDVSLILPDSTNIVTEPDSAYVAISLGSGNWKLLSYRPKGGDIPVGTELTYMSDTPPSGPWLLEDGSNVLRAGKYAKLFNVIGTTWGVGDGATTFTLPDSRRRVPVGKGGTGTSQLANSVGSEGGEENHVLTVAELAAHTHNVGNQQQLWSYQGAPQPAVAGMNTGVVSNQHPTLSTGSSHGHNNIQPSYVVTKIIKY